MYVVIINLFEVKWIMAPEITKRTQRAICPEFN